MKEIWFPGEVRLTGLQNGIAAVSLLAGGAALTFDSGEKSVTLPAELPDSDVSVVVVDLIGSCVVRNDMVPVQRADRSVVMPAFRAVLHGPNVRIEGANRNIGWGLSDEDSASFPFMVTNPEFQEHLGGSIERRPGTYAVVIEAAVAPGAGGTLTVTLNTPKPQVLTCQIEPTGGWGSYKDLTIGRVVLGTKGEFALELNGSKIRKPGFMNIKSVKLLPVDK